MPRGAVSNHTSHARDAISIAVVLRGHPECFNVLYIIELLYFNYIINLLLLGTSTYINIFIWNIEYSIYLYIYIDIDISHTDTHSNFIYVHKFK